MSSKKDYSREIRLTETWYARCRFELMDGSEAEAIGVFYTVDDDEPYSMERVTAEVENNDQWYFDRYHPDKIKSWLNVDVQPAGSYELPNWPAPIIGGKRYWLMDKPLTLALYGEQYTAGAWANRDSAGAK